MAGEADQIALLQEMNRALNLQAEALNTITQRLGGQAAAYQDVTNAAQKAGTQIEEQAQSTNILDSAINSLTKGWNKFTEGLTSWIPDSVKNGFSLLKTNIMSMFSVLSDGSASIQGFFNEIYNVVIKKASQLAQENIKYAEALENVRDKFGDLNENTSRQVVASARTLSSGLKEAAGGSNAFAGKFGIGVDAGVAKLQKMSEIAGDLGATFDALGEEGFKKASTELYVLKDGLAFTGEGLQATTRLAMISGESLQSFSQHIMASVDKIGKHFGMSTKVLGGDVGKALSNFKMLGKMTGDYVKEITKAAVFTRKLGIEITTLTGLVDKFDDFESGAEAAAQLAQGFGLVIDPLKMMGMEAGPRLAELQKGFIATGRSIESMSRQERALLASTSGLTDEQVQLAFSQKGLSMSYDDISKGANEAAEKQKSSQEVMVDLAKNIKNIIQPMLAFEGFIDAFFKGISMGFGTSRGFLDLIGTLAKQLTEVYRIGGQVGRILSDALFPDSDVKGKGGMLGYITNIGEMFVTIAKHVKYFIKALVDGEDVSTTVSNFFTNIFGVVDGTFEKSVGGFDIGSLASKFGTKIIEVFTGAVKFFVKQIPVWTAGLKGMFTGGAGAGATSGLMAPIFTAFGDLKAELPKLLPVLEDFGGALIDMIWRFFQEYPWISTISGLFVAGGPFMTVITGFGRKLYDMFAGGVESSVEEAGTSTSTGTAAMNGALDGIVSGVFGDTTTAAVKASASWFDKAFDIVKDPAKIALMAGSIASAIVTLGGAIHTVMMSFMEKQPGHDKSFVETVVDSAKLFKKVDGADLLSLGVVIGSVFAGVGAVVAAVALGASKLGVGGALAILIAGVGGKAIFSTGSEKGMISEALDAISSAVKDMATAFGSADFVNNLNIVAGLKDQLSSLAGVGESIEKVIKGITAISDAMPTKGFLPGGEADVDKMHTTVGNAIALLAGWSSSGEKVSGVRIGIVGLLKMLPDMTGLVGKDAGMSSISNIMTSIASVVKSLTDMPNADKANKKLDSLTSHVSNSFISNLSDFVGVQLGQFKNIEVPAGFNNVKDTINATVEIVKALGGLAEGSIKSANDSLKKMIFGKDDGTSFLDNLDTVLGSLGATSFNMGAETLINQLTQQKSVIDSINPLITALNEVEAVTNAIISVGLMTAFIPSLNAMMSMAISTLSTMPTLDPGISSNMVAGIGYMFDVIEAYTSRVDGVSEYLAQDKLDAFEVRIEALRAHVQTVKGILENLDTIDLVGTVNDVQKNMKVAKSVMTINGGAVNISVNMTVNMNAEKMAAALVMGGYIEPSPEFGPYLLNKDGVDDTFTSATREYSYGKSDNTGAARTWK
jgi:hypothetical protein